MINRSKRRSIIFKFNFSFLRMARSISISNSAICHRTLSLPPPLSPGSMKVETFERKHWLQIPLSCRRFDSLPGIQIEFSLSRSNDPLTNDFFPPPSCIRKHSHRSRYVSLLLFSNRFSFFFSSLTSVASIDEIIEEEISPRSYVNAYGGQASRNNNR